MSFLFGRQAVVDQLHLTFDQSFGLLLVHAGLGKALDKGMGIEGKAAHLGSLLDHGRDCIRAWEQTDPFNLVGLAHFAGVC